MSGRFRGRVGVPTVAFGAGSLVALASLLLASVVAARWMSPADYAAYAAFVSVFGLLVLATAAAVEQDTARRVAASDSLTDRVISTAVRHCWYVAGAVALIALVPLGWQAAVLGQQQWVLSGFIVAGAVMALPMGVLRGIVVGEGLRGVYGTLLASQGISLVALPVALILGFDVPAFWAFCVGTVVSPAAAGLPLLVLRTHVRSHMRVAEPAAEVVPPGGRVGLLVTANMLVSVNMLVIPALLKVHVGVIGPVVVASAQILVSVSRVSTLLVGNAQPLIVAGSARTNGLSRGVVIRLISGTAAFGVLAVVATMVAGPTVLAWVYGPAYEFTPQLALAASLSVVFLNPAMAWTGVAVAAQRYAGVAVSWGLGVVILGLAAVVTLPAGIYGLLAAITLSTVAVLLGLAAATWGRLRTSAQPHAP